ncbi:unnamed protein product [Colias eurytheme]|nr:unnamed protein product [Colias eurytheme]
MSVKKGKGPVFDPGMCRCCGTLKKCRVLNVEYENLGKKEVYSDMIMDCFGLLLSHLDDVPSDRLVCAACVHRIRDAFAFRQQILQCEEAFLKAKIYDEDDQPLKPPEKPLLEIKIEPLADDESRPATPLVDVLDDNCDIKTENPLSEKPVSDKITEDIQDSKPQMDLKNDDFMKWKATKPVVKPKISMSTLQQRIRERDPTYMKDTNIVTLVEFSYVCPFKCRHNNLLCYYCGENFTDPQLMRDHTLNKHNPKKFRVVEIKNMIKVDITRIDCRLCAMHITSLDDFVRHITSVHKKKYYTNIKQWVLPFRLLKDEIKCALCDCCFPYFHALNKHMNEHFSNYVCETCGLGFVDRGRFLMHQQRHDEKRDYPCEVCGKVFKAAYNKDLHVDRVHNKRGRVYCPKCDVRLMTYNQKLKHLVEVHGEAPLSFPCSVCNKVFETRRMLTIHRRKDHLKDYRYECQCCGQKFFTQFALNNHMPTHTGERNFKCKVCEKSYPRLKTLKDHIRIHTNDRRYRCHICGQAFIQNCSLKGHMKSQHPEYS